MTYLRRSIRGGPTQKTQILFPIPLGSAGGRASTAPLESAESTRCRGSWYLRPRLPPTDAGGSVRVLGNGVFIAKSGSDYNISPNAANCKSRSFARKNTAKKEYLIIFPCINLGCETKRTFRRVADLPILPRRPPAKTTTRVLKHMRGFLVQVAELADLFTRCSVCCGREPKSSP